MTAEPVYNQTIPQVTETLERELEAMRLAPDRQELADIDSDTAFELGYESAVHDLKRYTGDDPVELGVIIYTKEETDDQQ